jgi:3D (Asp-Asp-Asp) domain-containing protein
MPLNFNRFSLATIVRGIALAAGLILTVSAASAVTGTSDSLRVRFVRQSPLQVEAPVSIDTLAAQAAQLQPSDEVKPAQVKPVELMQSLPPDTKKKLLKSTPLTPGRMQVLMMEVTAYCPCKKCCGSGASGITASGRNVRYNDGRFVAADSRFKFGSRMIIPGYHNDRPVEVIDRGGAIKGDRLDVFFPTHQEAIAWGRRIIPVTVYN